MTLVACSLPRQGRFDSPPPARWQADCVRGGDRPHNLPGSSSRARCCCTRARSRASRNGKAKEFRRVLLVAQRSVSVGAFCSGLCAQKEVRSKDSVCPPASALPGHLPASLQLRLTICASASLGGTPSCRGSEKARGERLAEKEPRAGRLETQREEMGRGPGQERKGPKALA